MTPTTPQPAAELSDEQILSIAAGPCWSEDGIDPVSFARAILAAAAPQPQALPELPAKRKALASIINAYDAYRRRGVAPAPGEYADLVRAIDASRAALAQPAAPAVNIDRCIVESGGVTFAPKPRNYGGDRRLELEREWMRPAEAPMQAAPKGWQLAPIEATSEMLDADAKTCAPEAREMVREMARKTWANLMGAVPRLPSQPEQFHAAFEAGWNVAANWAGRGDLLADVGSPAYVRDRDDAMRLLAAPQPEPANSPAVPDGSTGFSREDEKLIRMALLHMSKNDDHDLATRDRAYAMFQVMRAEEASKD